MVDNIKTSENGIDDDIDDYIYSPDDFIVTECYADNGQLTHFAVLVKCSGQQVAIFSVDNIYNEKELNILNIAKNLPVISKLEGEI